MGKNSNVHKSRAYLALDIQREREAELKKQQRREKRELAAAEASGEMIVDHGSKTSAPQSMPEVIVDARGPHKFGKVKIGKKKVKVAGAPMGLKKSLENKKKSKGIRKPSSLMRKTLKKLARKREMEL